jgi:AraC-like DNA-binding protein
MDPLSEILALLKPRSYITAGFDAGGRWALRLDDLAGRIKCYAVIKGSCWLSVEGIEEPLHLSDGDCFVLPSGRTAVIASDLEIEPKVASEVLDPNRSGEVVTYNGGGDVYLVGSRFEVTGRRADSLLRTLPPLIQVKTSGGQAKLRWILDFMMEELHDKQPGASLVAQHLSHMMLAQALRLYLAESSRRDVGWFAALADPSLSAAIGAMHADPSSLWTLRTLAEKSNMSRSTFAQHFRDRVGETPISYLTRWRMMLAAEKLIHSRDNLANIALSLGYQSEHAFNTAFKRVMGCSPRRYALAESKLLEHRKTTRE